MDYPAVFSRCDRKSPVMRFARLSLDGFVRIRLGRATEEDTAPLQTSSFKRWCLRGPRRRDGDYACGGRVLAPTVRRGWGPRVRNVTGRTAFTESIVARIHQAGPSAAREHDEAAGSFPGRDALPGGRRAGNGRRRAVASAGRSQSIRTQCLPRGRQCAPIHLSLTGTPADVSDNTKSLDAVPAQDNLLYHAVGLTATATRQASQSARG